MRKLISAAIPLVAALSCVHLPSSPAGAVSYWGFAAPWDSRSLASIRAHESELSVVVSGWVAFDTVSFRPTLLYDDSTVADSTHPRRFALVTTYSGDRFHPDIIRGIAADSVALGRAAGAIAAVVDSGRYDGIVIDFEGMTVRDLGALLAATRSVADSSRGHGAKTVVVAVPAADTAAYPGGQLIASADYIMPMLYDEHWSGSAPGPIAEPEWVLRFLGARAAEVGATKVIAALPVYGYRWRSNSATEVVSFDDAMRLARTTNTPLVRDPGNGSLHAVSAQGWEIWLSDSLLLDSLVREGRRIGIRTFALWRLGLEDPAIWAGR